MVRFARLFLSIFSLITAALLLFLNACGGSSSQLSTTPPANKIEHVVIIFQENRTPDNLFHDQNLINAGADIASSGLNSSGQMIPLSPTPLAIDYDLGRQSAGAG